MFYNRARYLDPSTGQFISQDPLGFGAGDTNLYRYVFNNPLSFNDPSGLQAFVPTLSLNDQNFDGRDDSSEPGAIDLDGDGEIDDSGLASELFGSALAGLSILRAPASPINLPSPTPIELTPDVGDANTPSQLPDIPVDLPSLEGIPLGENIGQILVLGNDAIQTAQDIADAILESTDLDAAREIIENSHILLSESSNSGSVEDFVSSLPTRQTPSNTRADLFEIEQTGPRNFTVPAGDESINIDGFNGTTILEAKFAGNPGRSPFVEDSAIPGFIRDRIVAQQRDEFRRLAAAINDPQNPFTGLEVRTNDPRAVPFFESLINDFNIPGQVRVTPTDIN